MSSELDSSVVAEDEDEEKLYEFIYDLHSVDDKMKEEKDNDQNLSSSEDTLVLHDIEAESSNLPHADVDSTKGLDMDVLYDTQEIPEPEERVKSLEEKPWRKAGVDISLYFNYGFDEKSWHAYCKKQAQIRAAHRKLCANSRVQKGHNRHGEEDLCCSSTVASGESSASSDMSGCSSKEEGYHCPRDEGTSTQDVTDKSPEEDRITSYHLTPPINFSSLFAYKSPPSFLYRPEPPPLSHTATLDREQAGEFDKPSTSLSPHSSGASSLNPGSEAPGAGVINTAKAWESYIWQERCDKDGGRSRERSHDKGHKRGRDKESDRCASSHSSGKERMKYRDAVEPENKWHHFSRFSEEEDEEERIRMISKYQCWQTSTLSSSSSSSRSRRDDGEDKESQSRRKHKKAKRKKKDKETKTLTQTGK